MSTKAKSDLVDFLKTIELDNDMGTIDFKQFSFRKIKDRLVREYENKDSAAELFLKIQLAVDVLLEYSFYEQAYVNNLIKNTCNTDEQLDINDLIVLIIDDYFSFEDA